MKRTYGRLPDQGVDDAERVKRFLYLAHLNRTHAAAVLGIHRVTLTRYSTGAEPVPKLVLWALRGVLAASVSSPTLTPD